MAGSANSAADAHGKQNVAVLSLNGSMVLVPGSVLPSDRQYRYEIRTNEGSRYIIQAAPDLAVGACMAFKTSTSNAGRSPSHHT